MKRVSNLTIAELQQLIIDSVNLCLNSKIQPSQPEPNDRIDIDEACALTGYTRATIYKKIKDNEISARKYGKRLILSRKEVTDWMDRRTVSRTSSSEMIDTLSSEVDSKRRDLQ